jgi:hypothetical protein
LDFGILNLSQAKPSQAKPSQAKPSQAKPSQVQRYVTNSLLSVKERVKQHCGEINGNSYSVRNHIRGLNIMER